MTHEKEDNTLSNSLFPRYSHSYVQAKPYQPRFIVPTNSNCYTLSSPVLNPYTRVSSPYRPQPINNNYLVPYPPNPYVVNSYAVNHSANHHDKTNLVLIAILILASLDLIFVRPLKKNN